MLCFRSLACWLRLLGTLVTFIGGRGGAEEGGGISRLGLRTEFLKILGALKKKNKKIKKSGPSSLGYVCLCCG